MVILETTILFKGISDFGYIQSYTIMGWDNEAKSQTCVTSLYDF